jgi:hypothetical protein
MLKLRTESQLVAFVQRFLQKVFRGSMLFGRPMSLTRAFRSRHRQNRLTGQAVCVPCDGDDSAPHDHPGSPYAPEIRFFVSV